MPPGHRLSIHMSLLKSHVPRGNDGELFHCSAFYLIELAFDTGSQLLHFPPEAGAFPRDLFPAPYQLVTQLKPALPMLLCK